MSFTSLRSSVLALGGVFTLAACSSGTAHSAGSSHTVHPKAAPAVVANDLRSNAQVSSDLDAHPLSVTATAGKITQVKIEDAKGNVEKRVAFKKLSDSSWQVKGLLNNGEKYSLVSTAANADGKTVNATTAFHTVSADAFNSYTVFPYGDMEVGVGMPITVDFSNRVVNKSAVEDHLKVTSSNNTAGSWGWMDDKTVVWRPKAFWKPGTKVNIALDTKGLELGNDRFGRQTVTTSFKVGRKLEVDVSNQSKTATVSIDDKKQRSFPVSLGKPGHETSSGWNIIYEKDPVTRMKGEDYDEMVELAQRYNSTGEYLHSAPWSVWAQGNTNVSHGCVNIGPSNAKWLYGITKLGDLVHITGTGRKADTWDGMGAIWNYTPQQWAALDAKK